MANCKKTTRRMDQEDDLHIQGRQWLGAIYSLPCTLGRPNGLVGKKVRDLGLSEAPSKRTACELRDLAVLFRSHVEKSQARPNLRVNTPWGFGCKHRGAPIAFAPSH